MKKLLLTLTLLLYLPLANANEAEFYRGLSPYGRGDYEKAYNVWKPLAEQGHKEAQHYLGRLYAEGKGTIQNYVEAAKWHRKAAEQGHAMSQQRLASMYRDGNGVAQDYEKAEYWYTEAIKKGEGISRILLKRLKLEQLQKSAENGDEVAQMNLASIYFTGLRDEGINIPQDYKKAFGLYENVAIQGVASAQAQVGYMYHHGKGIAKNEIEALKWYNKAVKQGNATAQHNLATMYINSLAVTQNDLLAYMWLSIAIENGNEESKVTLNTVRGSMSSSERQKAQKMAKRCLESNYTDCEEKAWWKVW